MWINFLVEKNTTQKGLKMIINFSFSFDSASKTKVQY